MAAAGGGSTNYNFVNSKRLKKAIVVHAFLFLVCLVVAEIKDAALGFDQTSQESKLGTV